MLRVEHICLRTGQPYAQMCAAILFDLDGVLIDSSVCIARHWQAWAQPCHRRRSRLQASAGRWP